MMSNLTPHPGTHQRSTSFPTIAFTGALVLTLICVAISALHEWHSFNAFRAALTQERRLGELQGVIAHLDEVLTMSARMAAATGDRKWEARYRRFEPKLDAAIKEARQLAPNTFSSKAAAVTDDANFKLVDMEHRSFELVRQGQHAAAASLLASEKYESLKRVYSQGYREIATDLQRRAAAGIVREGRNAVFAVASAAAAFLLLFLVWLGVLRAVRRYVAQLNIVEGELRKHRDDLEELVAERTEALRESKDELQRAVTLLRNIIDSSTDFIFVKDTTLRTMLCNTAYAKAVGKRPEDLYGNTDVENGWDPELVHGNPAKGIRGFENDDRDALSGNTVHNVSDPANVHGVIQVFDTVKVPLRDAEGEIIGVLGISRDVTDYKRAEETLLQSESRFRALTEVSLAGVVIIREGRFEYVNPAMASMTGYSQEEMLALASILELVCEEDRSVVRENLRSREAGELQSVVYDFGIRKKDGALARVEVLGRSVVIEGRVTVISTVLDITDRKRIEHELHLRARLASLAADTRAAVAHAVSEATLLQRCTEVIVEHLDAAFARIWTLDAAGDTLVLRASAGMYTHLDGGHATVPVGHSKIGLIAAERKPHLTNHVIGDPLVSDQEWAQREGMVSFAGYPLIVSNQFLGVIAIFAHQPLDDATLTALGSVAYVVALGLSQRNAEEALRQSEERYRVLYETSRDAIMTLAPPSWRFTAGNPATVEMFRTGDEARFVFRGPWELSPEFQRDGRPSGEAAREMIETAMREGSHFFEWQYKRYDGEEFPATVLLTRVELEDHNEFLQATVRDITESKATEAALQESESKYKTIFQGAAEGIFVTDIETRRFQYINAAGSRMFRYKEEEFLRMEVPGMFSKEDLDYGKAEFSAHVCGEKSLTTNLPCCRKDGSKFYADVNTGLISLDGRPCIVGLFTDITERKRAEQHRQRLEEELRQSQKLGSMGTLASGVAHEINNPINGIMNYAQLLVDRLEAKDPLKEYAAEIVAETDRVAAIVRNLVTFARKESSPYGLTRMSDLMTSTLSLIHGILAADHITVEVDVPEDLPEIKCRSQLIQQVVMNLLTNARDALNARYREANEDRLLRVSAHAFEQNGNRWIRTTVEDHGIGIPEEIRERVFDPFFTTKDRSESSGLGLSVSFGIVRQHGGELHAESEPGKYTRFHLDLPAMEISDLRLQIADCRLSPISDLRF